ncbi:MAG: YheC/YheD family protein [Minisyncoccia bacterium]
MNRNKVILILYTSNINNRKPFFDLANKADIEKLFVEGEKEGIEFYRAPIQWFDINNNIFKKAWSFKNCKWKTMNNIAPDIVFDKCQYTPELSIVKNQIATVFKFVNDPSFDEITSNKFITYCFFSDFMARSYLIRNTNDLNKKIDNLNGGKFVLKPVTGNQGKDVMILKKNEIKNIIINRQSLLQEYIESDRGIKGIVRSRHDFRIIIFNKEIFCVYARIPQEGSFLANIAQGGSRLFLDKKEIPLSVLDIVKEIIKRFKGFDYLFYSADFIFDRNQKPYLLEINSRPRFVVGNDKNSRKFFDKYYKRIIKYFLEIRSH